MSKSIYYFLIILICCVTSSLFARITEQKKTDLHVDFAVFRGDTTYSLVEIYYAFERTAIQHIKKDNAFIARYVVNLDVFGKDSLLNSSQWEGGDRADTMDEIKATQMISHVRQLLLRPGKFQLTMTITDLSNQKELRKNFEIEAKPSRDNSLKISDLLLAIKIEKTEKLSAFTKNGFNITANPSQIFSPDWPVLYYYFEVYNLRESKSTDESNYTVKSGIYDSEGNLVKQIDNKTRPIMNAAIVEINKALVSSIKSGAYQLMVSVENQATKEFIEKTKDFYIYRSADFSQSETTSSDERDELYLLYLTKSETELDAEFEMVSYIASANEEDIYTRLDANGKREFFTNFWQTKSALVNNDKLTYRREFFDRVNHANNVYTTSSKKGWQTDRGRIIITFGIPDDIEKFYGGGLTKPYETWSYYGLEGGIEFVFLDISGYGNYRLVHSTAKEEIHDYDWRAHYGN